MGDATELRFVLTEVANAADEIHKAMGRFPRDHQSNSFGEGIQDGWNTHTPQHSCCLVRGQNLSGSFSAMESLQPQVSVPVLSV